MSWNEPFHCVLMCLPVARITHFLKLKLVGKTIAKASAIDDANVFGKVGTTGSEVEKALQGKKVSLQSRVLTLADLS